jgi:hypothetical protein
MPFANIDFDVVADKSNRGLVPILLLLNFDNVSEGTG